MVPCPQCLRTTAWGAVTFDLWSPKWKGNSCYQLYVPKSMETTEIQPRALKESLDIIA